MLRLLWLLPVLMILMLLVVAQPEGASHAVLRHGAGGVYIPQIQSVTFGTPFKYSSLYSAHTVNADGMGNTWADDDQIYINLDDTFAGFDQAVTNGRNTMIGKMTTYDSTAIGSNYSTMDIWGNTINICSQAANEPNTRSHKIAGIISIQGTMYAWAWRLDCTAGSGGMNGTLLKSSNHGTSWSPQPATNAAPLTTAQVMFPGNPFPMGFIQYGKDYSLAGPDNSSNYVYAMVLDDAKTATSRMDEWLGRCLISNIGNQNAADWTFWKGGDGMQDTSWGTLAQAQATGSLVHIAGNAGDTVLYYWNVIYLPTWQQYLTSNMASVPVNLTWTPYVAPHPWGPWRALPSTQYGSGSAMPLGSFPNPVSKSVSADGHSLTVFGSGDTTSTSPSGGNYTLWITPATVN